MAIIVLFLIVYAQSLKFVYVEGDDASTIAYHAMGRNGVLQPPYYAYQCGMDLVLSLLPADEATLRIGAMSLTALSTIVMVLLMFKLAFKWGGIGSNEHHKSIIGAALLLMMPELFYLGLVFTPAMTAMCFALASHLLLLRSLEISSAPILGRVRFLGGVLSSALLLGWGASLRWDVALYGWVIIAHLSALSLRSGSNYTFWRLSAIASIWAGLACLAWLTAIWVAGFAPTTTLRILRMAEGLAAEDRSFVRQLGFHQALFTPALLIFGTWGVVILTKRDWRLGFAAIASAIPTILWLQWSDPKGFIMFVPPIAVLAAIGFQRAWFNSQHGMWLCVVRSTVAILIVLPWICGFKATYRDTAWGPGFELRLFNRAPDNANRIEFGIGEGAAIPTPEGPRGLWGHGSILVGGGWKSLVTKMDEEKKKAINTAIERKLPMLQLLQHNRFMIALLIGKGFSTTDPDTALGQSRHLSLRTFSSRVGESVRLIALRDARYQTFLHDSANVKGLETVSGAADIILCDFPAVLRTIYLAAPDATILLGANSAIVNLPNLRHAFSKSSYH